MFENISGSAEMATEYNDALKAKEEAESQTVFLHNKLRGYKTERRGLKEQKEEADHMSVLTLVDLSDSASGERAQALHRWLRHATLEG